MTCTVDKQEWKFGIKRGAHIFLESANMNSRNEKQYTAAIEPDQAIEDNPATVSDEINIGFK